MTEEIKTERKEGKLEGKRSLKAENEWKVQDEGEVGRSATKGSGGRLSYEEDEGGRRLTGRRAG